MGSWNTLSVVRGSAEFIVTYLEVYIKNGYGGAVALDDIPLRGAVMSPGFKTKEDEVIRWLKMVFTVVNELGTCPFPDVQSCLIMATILAIMEAIS